jgi:hypothetical protein
MSFNRAQFLIEVLGADAARALAKAASRSEHLAQMIVPRTILAMLEATPAYAGTVPGFDECSLSYAKSEKGFTGNVTLGEDLYKFEAQSIFHVAGALATAMGIDSLMFNTGRDTELQRLGKSIDLMAKAHLISESKDDDDLSDEEFERKYDVEREKRKLKKKAMGEGSGKAAGPLVSRSPRSPSLPPPSSSRAPSSPGRAPRAASSSSARTTSSSAAFVSARSRSPLTGSIGWSTLSFISEKTGTARPS